MIPALRNAEFVRYGVMHRNTYLDSPRLLDRYYRVKKEPRVCFAGQITGVEGYVESTASGFLAAVELARRLEGKPPVDFPQETAVGALGGYLWGSSRCDPPPHSAVRRGDVGIAPYNVQMRACSSRRGGCPHPPAAQGSSSMRRRPARRKPCRKQASRS